jgi:hypothetical protein
MAAPWLAFVGAGLNVFGQLESQQQEQWAAEQDAAMALKNAKMAREAGAYNAERQQLEANQIMGRAVTDYGAAGIEMDSANVLDVLKQSAINSEMDRQMILRGSELQARQFEYEAQAIRMGAENAKKAGDLKMLAGLFSMGGDMAGNFGGGKKKARALDTGYDGASHSANFRNGYLKSDSIA